MKVKLNNVRSYSFIDRVIHNLAFNSTTLQNILSDLEESLYSTLWKDIRIERPIFITSLPRAGTTIILEALNRLSCTATHTYRDMPFILTPVLWNEVSYNLQNKAVNRERSHGDGLVISQDSPEAFEEILWKKYFPIQFQGNTIQLLNMYSNVFENTFKQHIKKIIYLRKSICNSKTRYISKNNCNISRIHTIKNIFPDALIIVPLRNPIEQAISLLRQHNNFSIQHRENTFSKKYMSDIGHFEFGELHRPITFSIDNSFTNNFDINTVNYWLSYWISAFEYLSLNQQIDFICYEKLCYSSTIHMAALCKHLKLSTNPSEIQLAAKVFRSPPAPRSSDYNINKELHDKALILYEDLENRCLLN